MNSIQLVCAVSLLFAAACSNEENEAQRNVNAVATPPNNSQTLPAVSEANSDVGPSEYDIEKIKVLVERNPWFAKLDKLDRQGLIDCVAFKIEDDLHSEPGSIWPSFHDDVYAAIDDIGRRNFEPYKSYCHDLIERVKNLM